MTPPGCAASVTSAPPRAAREQPILPSARRKRRQWRERVKAERDALERAKMFADALQSRINALTTDFVNRDDPAQRNVIAADRDKALAEMDRVKKEIEQHTKAIADIQEEARRAGVSRRLGPLKFVVCPFQSFSSKTRTRCARCCGTRSKRRATPSSRRATSPRRVQQLRQARPAVVLTDLKLPDGDGFGVLRAAKELDPELPVVVMTAYGSIQDAVTAMKEGAMDFLAKPVDPDHLLLMVERAIAQRRMLTEYILLKEELAERRGAPRIIGEDAKLRQVLAAAAPRGGDRRDRAARRRERHRQGAVRARAARAEPARRRPVRRHQLRGDSRDAARDRAVRPREGRVHRRRGAQAGPLRAGAPRHAVPRRDRRPAARRCRRRSCARSRRSSSSASAARSRCTSTCAWWRRPTAT